MKNIKIKKIQDQLSMMGLTGYEINVYSELIQVPKCGATKLAKISNVSRGRIYEVLDKLVNKGFCKIIPGSKNNYQAISPKIAIENYLVEFRKEMQQKEKNIDDAAIQLQKIYKNANKENYSAENVQILSSQSAIRERVIQLQYECKKVLRVFIKAPLIMGYEQKDSDDRLKDQIKKKLKIKQIFEYDEKIFKQYATSIFEDRKLGADFEVRVAMKLPLKLIIHDDEHVIFTLNKENHSSNNYSSMSVSNTYLTDALIELFEFYWEVAIPLEEFIKSYPLND